MEKQIYVGIDVSSGTLDICIRQGQGQQSLVIKNTERDIRSFLRKYQRKEIVIGMENTGRFNWALYGVLADTKHRVYVISPVHLKKSMGLVRGKNDKVDAVRIAAFVEKNQAELKPWVCPTASIQKLRILLTERTFRMKQKRQLLQQQHDYGKMKKLGLDRSLLHMNQKLMKQFQQQIEAIEKQIEQIIAEDTSLKQQAALMRTVPGVGKVVCWMMLAKTEGFKAIDNPRKMACYCGVVPFDYKSGTSVRGKPRISVYADKSMKSVLHLAAMSAIRLKNDLQLYYQRKVSEGKNKMSVLNAVRNKIIHRIYAVIKSENPYQNNLVTS